MDELDRVSDSRELAQALEKSSSVTLEQKTQLSELLSDAMPDMAVLEEALAGGRAGQRDDAKRCCNRFPR